MRMSPFEVEIRFQPHTPLDVLVSKKPSRNTSLAAYKFAKTRQDLLDEAGDNLEKADESKNSLDF